MTTILKEEINLFGFLVMEEKQHINYIHMQKQKKMIIMMQQTIPEMVDGELIVIEIIVIGKMMEEKLLMDKGFLLQKRVVLKNMEDFMQEDLKQESLQQHHFIMIKMVQHIGKSVDQMAIIVKHINLRMKQKTRTVKIYYQ